MCTLSCAIQVSGEPGIAREREYLQNVAAQCGGCRLPIPGGDGRGDHTAFTSEFVDYRLVCEVHGSGVVGH
jgi:hypothetical protein